MNTNKNKPSDAALDQKGSVKKGSNDKSVLSAERGQPQQAMRKPEKEQKQARNNKKDSFEVDSPTFVNRETVDNEGVYSQSLGFKDPISLSEQTLQNGKQNSKKRVSGSQLDDLDNVASKKADAGISSKSDSKVAAAEVKEQAKEMDWEGAASYHPPADESVESNFEIKKGLHNHNAALVDKDKKEPAKAVRSQVHEMDWEGAAVIPPTEKILDMKKASDSKQAVTEVKEQANEMDWEGAALHHPPADESVESNFEIKKGLHKQQSESRRVSSSTGESQKSASPKANSSNASKIFESPSMLSSLFGNLSTQKKDTEVFATASNPQKKNVVPSEPHDYNAHNLPPTPFEEITSAISGMAGRVFSKDGSSVQEAGNYATHPAKSAGPEIHTEAQDANPQSRKDGAVKTSGKAEDSSSHKKGPTTDYGSPEYLVRRS
eukprot:GDKJ01061181.1.p1 GENE.GDKJ01061181.1~~GDKJ01061181.1.p1  ORF type:complete len:480 (-),score=100.54 GDKJ01061181.1:163-1464(-)